MKIDKNKWDFISILDTGKMIQIPRLFKFPIEVNRDLFHGNKCEALSDFFYGEINERNDNIINCMDTILCDIEIMEYALKNSLKLDIVERQNNILESMQPLINHPDPLYNLDEIDPLVAGFVALQDPRSLEHLEKLGILPPHRPYEQQLATVVNMLKQIIEEIKQVATNADQIFEANSSPRL